MAQINWAKESHEKAWVLYLEERYPEAEKVLRENISGFQITRHLTFCLGRFISFPRNPILLLAHTVQ